MNFLKLKKKQLEGVERVRIKIINEPPKKIYEKAKELWGVDFENTIFTVGHKIYAKYGLPPDLMAHELVHVKQQDEYKGGWKAWWKRYFEDAQFRLEQETEAYREQYKYILNTVKDKNKQARVLMMIAQILSGKQYGNLIGYSEAIRILR